MRTLSRLLVALAIVVAGLFIASPTASACGYFTGYDDCNGGGGGGSSSGNDEPLGWKWVNPGQTYHPAHPSKQDGLGRHGIDVRATKKHKCKTLCGEGYRQRTYEDPGPLFEKQNYPSWFDYNRSCGAINILKGKC